MDKNISIIKTIDSIISHADRLGMYIEYIAMGTKLMRTFAQELSVLVDRETNHSFLIASVSSYGDTAIREVETESITVKYLFNQEDWIPLS